MTIIFSFLSCLIKILFCKCLFKDGNLNTGTGALNGKALLVWIIIENDKIDAYFRSD